MLLGNRVVNLQSDNFIELSLYSSSKGNQKKYYNKDTGEYLKDSFYYQGLYWKDSYVEHLSWRLSTMADTLGVYILKQEVVTIKDYDGSTRLGCVSKDFSNNGQLEWIPMYRLLSGDGVIYPPGASYRIFKFLISYVKEECNIDITNYLIVMIVFDYLLCNIDRHYNNFGILLGPTGYQVAPLFDFGLGLFEHDRMFLNKGLQFAIQHSIGKPFNEDLSQPIKMLIASGYVDKVNQVIHGICIPSKELFPSNLAYEYFCYALNDVRCMLCQKN